MSQHYIIDAIGSYVLRGNNPIYVKDYKMARALFALQDERYNFRPMPTVHKSENTCTSCEG